MAEDIVIPAALPTFTSMDQLRSWIVYSRYAEPSHQKRCLGHKLYDRGTKSYFHPDFTKLIEEIK